MATITVDQVLEQGGTGRFQRRLLGIFGLVWTADAMQVLAVGFTVASIAATFEMTMPEALQTGTLFFLGMLFGASLFGRLADRFGRRKLLLVTVAMDAVFGMASVFAQDFTTLLVLRFLTGLAVGGTLPVDYAMMAEFLPPSRRGRWLVALEGFWAVGTVIVALTAWIASTYGGFEVWRVIFFVTALPAIVGLFLRFWIPESPLHLLRQGREAEAKGVLNQMLRTNGQPEVAAARIEMPGQTARVGIFAPSLLRRTLLILAVWFLVSMCYYGVFTWMPGYLVNSPDFGPDYALVRGYGFLVVLALAQIPGYALAAYGVEAWGRRRTLIIFLVLSALGCALFAVAGSPMMFAVGLIVMSFALLGTWGALYAFTPELYPTSSRATGMGAAGAMARLGGLLAPSVLVYAFSQGMAVTIGAFAGLLLLAALLASLIVNETKDAALE